MTAPDRVRAPRDSRSAPPRLDRADADAAAERVLAGYRRQQDAATRQVVGGRRAGRWAVVVAMTVLGAALGALAGSLRGQAVPAAAVMAVLGALLGAITARR